MPFSVPNFSKKALEFYHLIEDPSSVNEEKEVTTSESWLNY